MAAGDFTFRNVGSLFSRTVTMLASCAIGPFVIAKPDTNKNQTPHFLNLDVGEISLRIVGSKKDRREAAMRCTCKLVLSLTLIALLTLQSRAGVIFLGPTPYLSAADSPFDLSSIFYLEDFEDRLLNTPGVSGNVAYHYGFPSVDSVDADDGAIDGFGVAGVSALGRDGVCTNTEPPICSESTQFEFSEDAFGRLPNAVGIVWTDGYQFDTFTIAVHDRDGMLIGHESFLGLGEVLGSGDGGRTDEDRFFGAIYGRGIRYLFIRQRGLSGHFEFDHVQYGIVVPEPSAGWLLGTSLIVGRGAVMMRGDGKFFN